MNLSLAFIRIVLRLGCGSDAGSYWKGGANATAVETGLKYPAAGPISVKSDKAI
jgi:hypothetical protein